MTLKVSNGPFDNNPAYDVKVTDVDGNIQAGNTQHFIRDLAVLTASSPTAATIGTSSGTALAANTSRKGAVFTNTSANRISFGIGVAAVLDSGITLNPGGVWSMDEYTFSQVLITAIASGASSNLAIQEFV